MQKTNVKNCYDLLYQNELKQEAEWLRRGAFEKANSIQYLLSNNSIIPQTILDLGCGTGAVIQECQHRGIAHRYVAVDQSREALDYLRNNSHGIELIAADITAPGFALEGAFDVVILSHVLEHLEKPSEFLRSLLRSIDFSYVIVEVPLEDLPLSKLKGLIRDRTRSKAGHVQFFTGGSLKRLLLSSNLSCQGAKYRLRIIDKRQYVPVLDLDTIRFVCNKDGLSKPMYMVKILTSHWLPRLLRPVWARTYYAHYAVLCQAEATQP